MATPVQPVSRSESQRLTLLNSAIKSVVDTLKRKRIQFALSGDTACWFYGVSRHVPFKVELMVLSHTESLDMLKRSIIQSDPTHFSLRPSKMIRFRDRKLPDNGQRNIDIIVTLLKTPNPQFVCEADGFPLAPYTFILLRKLQEWDILNAQPTAPAAPLKNLAQGILDILGSAKNQCRLLPHELSFEPGLQYTLRERVARFLSHHPTLQDKWNLLLLGDGLPTSTPRGASQGHVDQVITAPPSSSSTNLAIRDSTKHPIVTRPQLTSPARRILNGLVDQTVRAQPIPSTNIPVQDSKEPLITKRIQLTSSANNASASSSTGAPAPKTDTSKKPRSKRSQQPTSRNKIRMIAAKTTIGILDGLGFSCAIFGSMGCKFYGNSRIPNDIDILVIPPPGDTTTQEELKVAIVSRDTERFLLKDAKDPEATYKVLYFRLKESDPPTPNTASKVDILLPGVLHLPLLPVTQISWHKKDETLFPVVPFSVLLLQKLQGWDDHRNATQDHYTKKAPIDAKDIGRLLEMKKHVEGLTRSKPWSNRSLFSEEFELLSRERVKQFCIAFPFHISSWNLLGFET